MPFSKDFFWGGATASNQYEGGVFEGGAGLSTADCMTNGAHKVPRQVTFKMPDGSIDKLPLCFHSPVRTLPEGAQVCLVDDPGIYYPSHIASDFYHHYKEDIRLCAEEGFNCLRFSLKWSRIFPNGDDPEPNQEGIDFYRSVFEECRKYNIEPLVTLDHYENPLSLANRFNGFESRYLVDCFVKYATTCFEAFDGLVTYYLTFNEINCIEEAPFVTAGLIHGDTPQQVASATYHQFLASAKTVIAAHKYWPNLRIGMMLAAGPVYAYTCDPNDQVAAMKANDVKLFYSDVQMLGFYPQYKLAEYEREGVKLPILPGDLEILKEGTCDYLSFSLYGSSVITTHTDDDLKAGEGNGGAAGMVANPYLETNAWGWATDPQTQRITLNMLYNRYHCDLWCVESGIGWNDEFVDDTVHDDYRIAYMRANIQSMKDAVELDGIPLMGYLYWGCVDMVSNGEGEMAKRYGQIYVDADNYGQGKMKRYLKDSYHWFKKVIESNGEDLD